MPEPASFTLRAARWLLFGSVTGRAHFDPGRPCPRYVRQPNQSVVFDDDLLNREFGAPYGELVFPSHGWAASAHPVARATYQFLARALAIDRANPGAFTRG